MRKMKAKFCKILLLVSLASVFTGGALSVSAATNTTIDESAFTMYKGASVRVDGTAEHPNAKGLRFKTYATEFKDDLLAVYPEDTYKYHWYSELRFKMWDGVSMNGDLVQYTSYESQVNANVWHEEGWNTVLLAIPDNAVAIDIAAQSFVEVKDKNGATVYALSTNTVQYSAAQTASWALSYNAYKTADNYNFLLNYVDKAVASGDVQDIRLDYTTFGVEVGKSDDLQAVSYPTGYGITYTSDNESVATVDGNGRVTGIAQGTANITLSIGSTIQKTCKVTVRANGDLPVSYTSWTNTDKAWIYKQYSYLKKVNDIRSQMYPFYHGASENTYDKINDESGTGQVVNGKIKLTSIPWPAYYTLDSAYVDNVFALSQVKALRIKLTGLSAYDIAQFKLHFTSNTLKSDGTYADHFSHEDIHYYKDGDTIWLQFNRGAYNAYLANRKDASTPFRFRLMFHNNGGAISGAGALVKPNFTVEEISPVYDSVTEDFEYGMPAYIGTDASAELVKVTDRTMGRGGYSLQVIPQADTLNVTIDKSYTSKVFTNGSALQFRVYTDKDLQSLAVNGSTSGVQYVYNADGQYYTIRISNAYANVTLSVQMKAYGMFGTAYVDAFTATDKALGNNLSRAAAYAQNDDGMPDFQTTKTFNFFAYNSLSDGKLDGADYAFADLTLETMLELKEAGFTAIMPQTFAQVNENGGCSNPIGYRKVMDLAHQAGLKVILTDSVFLAMSAGANASAWGNYYNSARETNGTWQGAAAKGTPAYEKVAQQLSYYIDHPAFMGVLVRDEPSAWMFDESLTAPSGSKAGTYAMTYKTIKRVAMEKYGKDIYIHANLLPTGSYTQFYNTHDGVRVMPELTVAEYGAITGMSVSSYAVDGKGYATNAQFYADLENYIAWIGANTSVNNSTLKQRDIQIEIMRARYGKYCELFLQKTGSPYLMADMYPIGKTMEDHYLMELQAIAEVAAEYGADLHLVTQTMTMHKASNVEADRTLTEADLRWLNNTLLSFGVKNIVYFTYHVHDYDGSNYFDKDMSFIDETGEKTNVYYAMQQIMAENKAFEKTYQSFTIQSTKAYYNALAVQKGMHGRYVNDVNYADGSLYKNENVSFAALTNVAWNGNLTLISEYKAQNGCYMYSVMNATDGKYSKDTSAYEQVTMTFGDEYTHAIVWRNGVKTLVKLDANNSLELENGAGEAVFVIPYKYINKNQSGFIVDGDDNGMFFPDLNGQSNIYVDLEEQDNGTFFPDLSK